MYETQAVEAFLRGLRAADLDFTEISAGFYSEKQAFLEIVKLIKYTDLER